MCGRYTLAASKYDIDLHYGIDSGLDLKPRYNISPSTYCPIVRLNHDRREAANCHWGLIPAWAKDAKIKPINAKAETIQDKPFFRGAFKHRRCLVPATGYYEWKTEKGGKQPYHIQIKGQKIISFAGLWEAWEGPEGILESFTIITTDANKRTAEIHNRMPVILQKSDYDRWLVDGDSGLLKSCPDDMVDMVKVSTKVNKTGNEGRDLIRAV